MKHNVSLVVIVVVAMLAVFFPAGVAGASRSAEPLDPQVAGPLAPQAGAPQVVSYQGQVNVNGAAFTGTGYFEFAVVDAAGTTSYWSNDGTSTGGGHRLKPSRSPSVAACSACCWATRR